MQGNGNLNIAGNISSNDIQKAKAYKKQSIQKCLHTLVVPGVLAAITLYLHICFLRDRCKSTATQLGGLMLTGCVFQLAGVCGFVAYLVLAISEHQGK